MPGRVRLARGSRRQKHRAVPRDALARDNGFHLRQQREHLVARGRPPRIRHAEAVERPAADERFGLIASRARTAKEVPQVVERTRTRPRIPLALDRRSKAVGDVKHVAQSHPDRPPVLGGGVLGGRRVDVRHEDIDVVTAGVVEDRARAVEAHRLVVHHADRELRRVVVLQPCARVADDGEARRVSLVEAVGGETGELAEDLLGHRFLAAEPAGALDEVVVDRLHLLARAVFRHGTAKAVRLGEVESGHLARHGEHLLLVDDDAVRVAQRPSHPRVRHAHRFQPVPAADERSDHLGLERTRPEERYLRDDVLEPVGLEARREVSLPARLELEHPYRIGRGDLCVDGRIVVRSEFERFRHDVLPHALPRELHRIRYRRVHPQPQHIQLHQPEGLDVVLVVLRHHHALGRPLQRRPRVDRLGGDEEAAEVRAEVHRAGVEPFGEVEEHRMAALVAKRVVRALRVGGEHLAHLAGRDPGQVTR